ncbi:MAG: hypothetical protein OHK006_20890 [Thermodesulfovibrionales bacterium]
MAGEVLKKKREDLGLEIRQVSDTLRVRPDYLEAIENDLFDKLPVAVYTKGYIRGYASYLKVEADPIISFYDEHLSHPRPSTIYPIAATRRKTPAVFLLLPIALLALGAGGFLFYHLRESVQKTAPAAPVQPPAPAAAAPVAPQPAADANAPSPVSVAGQPLPSPGHRLLVSAQDRAWLQITFRDGRTEEMLMRPGDTKNWEFSGTATLKMGNAGGITIQLDEGEPVVPGTKGQVLTMRFPRL